MKTYRPPFNTETEEKLLRCLLNHKEVRGKIFNGLTSEDFYNKTNGEMFKALQNQFSEKGDFDLLGISGAIALLSNPEWVSPLFADKFIEEIKRTSRQRQIGEICLRTIEAIEETDSDKIVEELAKIKHDQKESSVAQEVYYKAINLWDKIKNKDVWGVPSHTFLDKYIHGYQEGHYWIIGAYTNYGKTTFMCYLASLLDDVAIFSTEMSKRQILEKILCQKLKQPITEIINNYEYYAPKIEDFTSKNIHIYDDKLTVSDIRLELMNLKIQGKMPKVVFVDFIQNVKSTGKSLYERLSEATLELQRLAREMNVCLIALSQISNDGANKPSEVIPFKGSGDLASSADLGLQIVRHRQEELQNKNRIVEFTILIVKNRHGQLHREDFEFDTETGILNPIKHG